MRTSPTARPGRSTCAGRTPSCPAGGIHRERPGRSGGDPRLGLRRGLGRGGDPDAAGHARRRAGDGGRRLPALARAADEAEIVTLAVRPEARRRGLGGRLLDRVLDRARDQGVARLFLEVAHDNDAALALYASRGFEQAGGRPAYYARPDGVRADALILALNLA
ncbi:GNAT family N-acetyltransferase [Brevundimonas denitrificans]|uniref:GNAT family N-acetyltransferase n=1 Tax=Brevundimonas denitrificans TaxID=1443434 RepID=UPI00223B3157|nr:GNAT family N-acetyltransferase [Brevundimonas denitrificans]